MTYLPGIPLATDLLSVSQGNIKDNFTVANTVMGINHYPFDDGTANQGKHKFVEMLVGTLPAGLVSGEGTIYVKAAISRRELFYTNDASGNEWQLTSISNSSFATFGTGTNYSGSNTGGWTFLPGGLLLQYGFTQITSILPPQVTITYPRSFTTLFSIQVTPRTSTTISGGNHDYDISSPGASTTDVSYDGYIIGDRFYWVAIGSAS